MLYRVIILLLLVVIAYIPACQGDFIWDDDSYVTENLALREPGGLRDIWIWPIAVAMDPDQKHHYWQFKTPQYYPMVFTTFWVEYRLWGLNPAGYHWVNVAIHGLNAGLLWLLLRRLRIPFPWLAAAIFALHPVHVESVAWITERKNVLSGFFYLIASLAYLRFSPPEEPIPERGKWGWYAVSLFAFVAALLSKSVTCSLPAVLLLVYWWKRGWPTRREIFALVPMFVIGLALALNTSRIERDFVGARGEDWNFSLLERCLIAGRALWFYVGKLLWPHPLIFNYERWHIDTHQPWQYLFPLGCLAMFVILALPLTPLPLPKVLAPLQRLGKGPLVACLIFAGTLFPALGFVDIYPMIFYFVADHFQYLASIAIICLAMAVIHALGRQWPWIHAPEHQFLLLLVLGYLTWRQGAVYQNLGTLWSDTRTKNPDAWVAHYNIGLNQAKLRNYNSAFQCFQRVIEIHPGCSAPNMFAYCIWGDALWKQSKDAETLAKKAQKAGNEALARDKFAEAKRTRALALEKLQQALENNQNRAPGFFFHTGSLIANVGDNELAITYFEQALEAIPKFRRYQDLTRWIPQFEYNLANLLLKVGRREEALTHAHRAAEIAQRDVESHPGVEQYEKDLVKYNELVKKAQDMK